MLAAVRTLLVLALLVGCGAVPEPSGGPCIQQSDCPSGQFCVRGRCSLSPDGGLPTGADRDADGVVDDSDNCPDLANADQSDEDGDGKGDACDPCPLIKNEPAGACDPAHPTQTEQWLFESFHKDPRWSVPGQPAWTVAGGDALAVTAATPSSAHIRLAAHTGTRSYDDFTITAQFVVDARVAGQRNQLGLAVTIPGLTPALLSCRLDLDVGRGDLLAFGEFMHADQGFPWPAATPYQLAISVHDGRYDCVIRTAAGPTPLALTPATPAYPTSDDALDLFADQVTAHVDWVYVVGSPSK